MTTTLIPPTGIEHESVLTRPYGRTVGWATLGAVESDTVVVVLDGPGSRGLPRALSGAASAAGIRLLTPDRPGFFATAPWAGMTVADWPADLAAILDELGLDRVGLLAQSGGTPFALAAAVALPDRVASLAFCGAVAPFDVRGAMQDVRGPLRVGLPLARRAPWLLRRLLGAASKQAAKDVDAAADKALKDMMPADAVMLEDPAWRSVHVQATGEILSRPDAMVAEMRLIASPWGIDLGAVRAPAALWVGEHDSTHPPVMARRLAASLGHAPVTVVPGAATLSLAPCFPEVLRAATTGLRPALG